MPTQVSIVMYHFVRNLKWSRYPRIKGLDLHDFRGQLAYLKRHYEFIRMEDLIDEIHGAGGGLPPRAVLMTFDDGYLDHYLHVFPALDELGIQGSFFPPASVIARNQVLDVNKVHFILASVEDPSTVAEFIVKAIDERRQEFGLREGRWYYESFSESHRFDSREVTFIKRILQRGLPNELRAFIVDQLFKRYVTSDEIAFCRELYLDMEQLKCMVRNGMFVGSHGYEHIWLNHVEREVQETEIDRSLRFLAALGIEHEKWVMCYPYGGYDESLLSVLREKNCSIGLTAQVDIADTRLHDPLLLPRLDTNDLPCSPEADLSEWTRKAIL